MKQKKTSKSSKKFNVTLRRRLTTFYYRSILLLKLAILLFFGLLIFTPYLDFIKQEVAYHFNEVTGDLGFKLKNVEIEGQENLSQATILSSLNADTGTPIFSIDLAQIKAKLEENGWVKQVAVQRRLPSTLHIAILEKIPIALWQINQKIYLIDEEGAAITDKNIEKFSKLLHVVGPDANLYAARLLEDLSSYPALNKKIISVVRFGQRRWNLNLQQNITAKMPEIGFLKALNYLNELDKSGKLLNQNYKTIDLRDSNKYYVEKF